MNMLLYNEKLKVNVFNEIYISIKDKVKKKQFC